MKMRNFREKFPSVKGRLAEYKSRRIIFFIFLILFSAHDLCSQQYYFRKYSVEEGLPHSSVYSFMQDSRGYIWMGTIGGGLTMFDGFRFTTYTTESGLSDNNVRSVMEDRQGNIWIGTDFGVTVYDGITFRQLTRDNGLGATAVIKIIESADGIIWAGTNDGGLLALSFSDSVTVKQFTQKDGLSTDFIYDILEDSDKKLWLGMAGGINIIEVSDADSLYLENVTDPMLPSDLGLAIAQTPDGTILVGTRNDGLFEIDQNGNEYDISSSSINSKYPSLRIWDIIVRPDEEIWLATDENGIIRMRDGTEMPGFNKNNGLPSNRVINFIIDNEGNTWFATLDQGAVMFRDQKFITYRNRDGLPGNMALSVFLDPEGKLYTGTDEGLSEFRKNGDKIDRTALYTTDHGLNDQKAGSMVWYDNKIYIGTNDGINIFDGKKISSFPFNSRLPVSTVNVLFADSRNNLYIGTAGGYSKYSGGQIYSMSQDDGLINNEVQSVIEDKSGNIWIGTLGGLARITGDKLTDFVEEDGLAYKKINCLAEDPEGNIWIGTFGGGIFKFDSNNDSLPISLIATNKILSSNNINSLLFLNDSTAIAGTDKGFDLLRLDSKFQVRKAVHYGADDGFTGGENLQNAIAMDKEGFVWFGTKNGLIRYNPGLEFDQETLPEVTISGVRLFFENVDWKSRKVETRKWTGLPESLVLSHKENHVTFDITGFFYSYPADLLFSYYLEPQSKGWSPWTREREISFQSLSPGHYNLRVKAMNKFGVEGNTTQYSFIIKPPFYKTKWFIAAAITTILLSFFAFFRYREKKLLREKIKLEDIVRARTREVVEQKDEIVRQRDVVTSQKKEITDSINYAERIQKAVMPDDTVLRRVFSEYFIILKPKDIVSGDFYWLTFKNNKLVFAAADCTGHGVPGAFMSMLGVSFLNKIVNESGITEPSAILNSLRENVISALKQKGGGEDAKDGMDIAICCIDAGSKNLYFAGANNPLYLIRNQNGCSRVVEYKADSMPVGVYSEMRDFKHQQIELEKGDTIYLTSDGFLDQFGGPSGKKFMKSRFRQMLLDNQVNDMAAQKDIFLKTIDEWMNYPSESNPQTGQTDDIILIGVRL